MAGILLNNVNYSGGGGGGSAEFPSGGTAGQALVKASNADNDVAWGSIDGIPSGGTTGQALVKVSSADNDVTWGSIAAVPAGGSTGQVLKKRSGGNNDVTWGDSFKLPSGGTTGQILRKHSNTDDDVEWGNNISVSMNWVGTASNTGVRKQQITINGTAYDISGTAYMEQEVILSTTDTTEVMFSNDILTTSSVVDVAVNIWGIVPNSVLVTTGSCIIELPKVASSQTVLLRIYIR